VNSAEGHVIVRLTIRQQLCCQGVIEIGV